MSDSKKKSTKGSQSKKSKESEEKGGKKGKVIATAAGVAVAAAAGVAAVKAVKGSKKRTVYHLLPREDDWEIRAEDETEAESVHKTKKKGLEVARKLARNNEPSQLVVHKSDGTIETSYSYGEE